MLPMKFTTVEGLIKELTSSSIKQIYAGTIETVDDVEEIYRSTKTILRKDKLLQVLLIAV